LEGHSLIREDISATDTYSTREKGGIFLGTSVAEDVIRSPVWGPNRHLLLTLAGRVDINRDYGK
jgi:hypothetical protein